MQHDAHSGSGEGRLTEQELAFINRALDGELLALKKNNHYAARAGG